MGLAALYIRDPLLLYVKVSTHRLFVGLHTDINDGKQK